MITVKVKEKLSDGTLILSNGFKVLPSLGTMPDGTTKKLSDMTTAERQNWESRLMKFVGEKMTDFYRNAGAR